jgi:hypothetical protein
VIERAKHQASHIVSIDGQPPRTCCGSVADLSTAPITIHLEDPPAGGNQTKQLRLENDAFWQFYYGSLAAFITRNRENVQVDGLPDYSFARVYLLEPGGLLSQPVELYLGLPTRLMLNPSAATESSLRLKPSDSPYVGLDHIALAGRMPHWPVAEGR